MSQTKNKERRPLGAIFTPLNWGTWAAKKWKLTDQWLNGSTVLDPTCGDGRLLEALIRDALNKGVPAGELPLHRLFGIEREENFLDDFRSRLKSELGIRFPEKNLVHADFLTGKHSLRCDILFGNPPWCNFNDLPEEEKETLKPLFRRYGLIKKSTGLLLGGSRIDIAALVITKAITQHLAPGGRAVFFAPLSLVLGEGAHAGFRHFCSDGTSFAVSSVHDFGEEKVFDGIHTRHGLFCFGRDKQQEYPVPFYLLEGRRWTRRLARPLLHSDDAWVIGAKPAGITGKAAPDDPPALIKPRQGVNTGGANAVFHFHDYKETAGGMAEATNGFGDRVTLPAALLFPLLDAAHFSAPAAAAKRHVLLPYHSDGSLMQEKDIRAIPQLLDYLEKYRSRLESRKGTLLRAKMRNGCWWALFGVGNYNFAPYKVVWEAYGRDSFRPLLVSGRWQANQSLQAFVPFSSRQKAQRFLRQLHSQPVEKILRSQGMKGTMNWAQPGKMAKLFRLLEF